MNYWISFLRVFSWYIQQLTINVGFLSDNTLRVWDTESGDCLHILEGHSSRIWDVSSNEAGNTVASASGDSTVKIWDIRGSKSSCRATLGGHSGDVYTVKYHPTSVRGKFLSLIRDAFAVGDLTCVCVLLVWSVL